MVISSECGSCVIFCNYVTIAFLAYFMYIARLTQGALGQQPVHTLEPVVSISEQDTARTVRPEDSACVHIHIRCLRLQLGRAGSSLASAHGNSVMLVVEAASECHIVCRQVPCRHRQLALLQRGALRSASGTPLPVLPVRPRHVHRQGEAAQMVPRSLCCRSHIQRWWPLV